MTANTNNKQVIYEEKLQMIAANTINSRSSLHRPHLDYLKAVNMAAPPQDPQLLFLLMGEYANANMPSEGAEFFSARLKDFEPR